MASLKSCENKGFQMTFTNGWTVSVQFGPYNYCSNRSSDSDPMKTLFWQSNTAEVAVWDAEGNWLRVAEYDDVEGNVTPNAVAELLWYISALPSGVLASDGIVAEISQDILSTQEKDNDNTSK